MKIIFNIFNKSPVNINGVNINAPAVLLVLLVFGFGISTLIMRQSDREKARAGEKKTEEIVQSPESIDDGESEYAEGEGEQENGEELVEQEYAAAQYKRGNKYRKGEGVPQDYGKAAECFLKAAKLGHVSAQYNLANRYLWGQGVQKSYKEAAKWYLKAAVRGHNKAKINLVWTVILRLT